MKKIYTKPSDSEADENKVSDPFEIIYAYPRDEEIQLNFLKRRQLNAHMARWFLDYEYNQLLWSDGIYELLELDPRNFGANEAYLLDRIHPDDRSIKTRVHSELQHDTKPIEINYRLQFDDGRIKWINEICSTEFDKTGHPVRSYGTILDITKYKLAEENFKQKESGYKSLIENLPSGIIISKNNKCVFFNPAAESLLRGESRQQLYGKSFLTFIHPTGKTFFLGKLQDLNTKNFIPAFEQKMIRQDGSKFDAEVTLVQTTFQGFPAVQIIINDITIRNKAEELLKENEIRLEELIATKDKFFSIIAHDLRSPFNSIIGLLELLINQYEKFNDSERKDYLSLINEDAKRTLKLLNDLLEWAKLQTGKLSFEPRKQKLLPIIEYVSNSLYSAMELKQLGLSYSISDEFEVIADTNMLTTILQNLIGNAIKYSKPNGIIRIDAHLVNNSIEFSVADNGIGMSDDTKSRLFRIDQQISISGTANEKGSGLGLMLCKDFIESHQGKIWVESQLGKGSKFIFSIPQ